MSPVPLKSLTRQPIDAILPNLVELVALHGGWLLGRKPTSPTSVELELDLRLCSVFEIYSALLASGLELNRDAHVTLVGFCASLWHTEWSLARNRALSFRLEIRYVSALTPALITSAQLRSLA